LSFVLSAASRNPTTHEEHVMTIRFLKDAPFKGSHGVYFAIKLAVLVLAVLLALHFFSVV
jgi:hypothetical protein